MWEYRAAVSSRISYWSSINIIHFLVGCILPEFGPQSNSSEANNEAMLISYLFAIFAFGKIHLFNILIRVSWSVGLALAQNDRVHTPAERTRLLVSQANPCCSSVHSHHRVLWLWKTLARSLTVLHWRHQPAFPPQVTIIGWPLSLRHSSYFLVHAVRPADIKHIAAMGDSLTVQSRKNCKIAMYVVYLL